MSIFYECCQLVGDDFPSGFVNAVFLILLYKDKQGIKLRPEDSTFLGCYAVTNSKHLEFSKDRSGCNFRVLEVLE